MEQNQDVSMITCLPNPTTKNSNHSLMKTGPNVECDKPLKENLIHGFGKNKLDGINFQCNVSFIHIYLFKSIVFVFTAPV